jgi:hypothetical protein
VATFLARTARNFFHSSSYEKRDSITQSASKSQEQLPELVQVGAHRAPRTAHALNSGELTLCALCGCRRSNNGIGAAEFSSYRADNWIEAGLKEKSAIA